MLGAIIGDLAGSIYEYDEFKSKEINLNRRLEVLTKDNLIDDDCESVSTLMNNIDSELNEINIQSISSSGRISSVAKDDICYILIYKYLLGMKIRRVFEKKAVEDANVEYTKISDLIPYLNNYELINFYSTYSFIINSFNHSSSRIVPPIFVYSTQTLQKIYDELKNM